MRTFLFIALRLSLSLNIVYAHIREIRHYESKNEDWAKFYDLEMTTQERFNPTALSLSISEKFFDWATWKWKIVWTHVTEPHSHLESGAPPPAPEIANTEWKVVGMVAEWYGFPNTIRGIE